MDLKSVLKMRNSPNEQIQYIHQIPYDERKNLCSILDESNKYQKLAEKCTELDQITIKELTNSRSPTNKLLVDLSSRNFPILKLFVLLGKLEYYPAMVILKPFVDTKYHSYIDEEKRINKMSGVHENEKINNVQTGENNESVNNLVVPQLEIDNVQSRENNESTTNFPVLSPLLQWRSQFSGISSIAEPFMGVPQIPYEELQRSTNNWDIRTALGQGGFGCVFKATWKCTQVAVKRIEAKQDSVQEEIRQLFTELGYLNTIRHDNILSLYAYSIGGPHPCLVYQYMAGGSLEGRLHHKDPQKWLSWAKRYSVARGVACGLQFMHNVAEKPVIHGDIKSANILLDQNDHPRIGDFGLARDGPQQHLTHITVSRPQGTKPYLPNEVFRNRTFSTKLDTYSFGVVLFEIATGLGAYNPKRGQHKFLRDHVLHYNGDIMELKDARVEGGDVIFKGLMDIGRLCVQYLKKDRPEMQTVLIKIEEDIKL